MDHEHDLRILDPDRPLGPQFQSVDVVIDLGGSEGTREMADAAKVAKLWQILGNGFDHFDVEYWKSLGIPVANCPGPMHAVALAEHALMFMLMLSREYPTAHERLNEARMYGPVGSELEGRMLAVVGFGASGRERATAFGMRINAIDVLVVSDADSAELGVEFSGTLLELDAVLGRADFVSLHLPLNEETRHIIDDRRIRLMKHDAFLINVARGALIDEAALRSALVDGRIAGGGLDVFSREPPDRDDPLLLLPNVITTPHHSGATDGTIRRRVAGVATNVGRVADGLEPLWRVD